MKPFFLSLSILGVITPSAAIAGQILPTMYAREYCSLRELGVSREEAMNSAIATSYVDSLPDLPTVTIDGSEVSTDSVRAARAVESRCPQYL